jgi:hypothetical protein
MEYVAQAVSPLVNGEVKLSIGENSFTITALFDVVEIPFVDVNSIELMDYTVTVNTGYGNFVFSRMGQWVQPFYSSLYEAYNKAVLRSFFVSGNPFFKTEGIFSFIENNVAVSMDSKVPIHVYENCVVALPPNDRGRRIPLCFVVSMDKGDYELTLKLCTGESYSFSKLGHSMDSFVDAVEKQLRILREKSIDVVKEFDLSLTAVQASQIAKLIPNGVAVPMGQLAAIAPSFAETVELKLANTRATDSYKVFKEWGDPMQIWVGVKKNDAWLDSVSTASGLPNVGGMPDGLAGDGNSPEALNDIAGDSAHIDSEKEKTFTSNPYLFWIIVPSPDGRYAAVEFLVNTGESAATFVYRTDNDFSKSATLLNQALEAISFRREMIRLTKEELLKPQNADYYMSTKRTLSLQFIREKFVGRVIHLSVESWKRKLTELWNADNTTNTQF